MARGVARGSADPGIREEIVDAALADVSEPLPIILERDRARAETVFSLEQYLSRRLTTRLLQRGRDGLRSTVSCSIGRGAYGVPAASSSPSGAVESNYGRFSGVRPAVSALATLAWDPRRTDVLPRRAVQRARDPESRDIDLPRLARLLAGAMGQVSSCRRDLKFAEDFDGDGARDHWSTRRTSSPRSRNYLRGTRDGGPDVGREVRLTSDAARRIAGMSRRATGTCRRRAT